MVRYYVEHRRPKAEAELDWFRGQPSLTSAIYQASLALDRRGKRLRHQTRIPKEALDPARASLMEVEHEIAACDSFEAIHQIVMAHVADIRGIGPLYLYDTSLRIGAFLGLLPRGVFLHAGTLTGARRLLGRPLKERILSKDELPAEFAPLRAHEIEDFLCIFKGKFGLQTRAG